MDNIVANIVQQIDREAAAQQRLSDEYTQRSNILQYYTHGNPFFSGLETNLTYGDINDYNSYGGNMRPGNFGDLSDTWFGEFAGRGRGRGRGMRRAKARGGRHHAKKHAFRAKARAAGWHKGPRNGIVTGPCVGLRGWRKWRCRMQMSTPVAPVVVAPTAPTPPAPDTGLLGLGFWGL